jgi:hypothetical protein
LPVEADEMEYFLANIDADSREGTWLELGHGRILLTRAR